MSGSDYQILAFSGLFILVFYCAFLELLKSPSNKYASLVFMAGGLILNSLFGGLGQIGGPPSFLWSLQGMFLGLLLFLPLYYPGGQKIEFLFYLCAIGAFKGSWFLIYQYMYMVLACSLLSFLLMIYKGKIKDGLAKSLPAMVKKPKEDSEDSKTGIQAPYYTAGLIGTFIAIYSLGFK